MLLSLYRLLYGNGERATKENLKPILANCPPGHYVMLTFDCGKIADFNPLRTTSDLVEWVNNHDGYAESYSEKKGFLLVDPQAIHIFVQLIGISDSSKYTPEELLAKFISKKFPTTLARYPFIDHEYINPHACP